MTKAKLTPLRAVLLSVSLIACGWVLAQESAGDQAAVLDEREEIVVKGEKPGSVKRAERLQIERLRAQLLKDFRENEEMAQRYGWRRSETIKQRPSRFKWGYDSEAEMRMRRETQLVDTNWAETRPVSVFKVKF